MTTRIPPAAARRVHIASPAVAPAASPRPLSASFEWKGGGGVPLQASLRQSPDGALLFEIVETGLVQKEDWPKAEVRLTVEGRTYSSGEWKWFEATPAGLMAPIAAALVREHGLDVCVDSFTVPQPFSDKPGRRLTIRRTAESAAVGDP